MGRATARREFSKFQEIVNHGNFVIQTGLSRLKVSSGAGEGNESTIYEADSRALTSLFQPPFPGLRIFIGGPFIFPVSRAATKCPR